MKPGPTRRGQSRVLVLSDTHLRDGPTRRGLPRVITEEAARADVILHAGDVVEAGVLQMLEALTGGGGRPEPAVRAVLGNNDIGLAALLPMTLELELSGVRIGMIHDSGPAAGRERRLHDRFPACGVVVFGHSHIPWKREGLDGQLLFNPGSPTQRRAQPQPTYGILLLDSGRIEMAEIRPVPG